MKVSIFKCNVENAEINNNNEVKHKKVYTEAQRRRAECAFHERNKDHEESNQTKNKNKEYMKSIKEELQSEQQQTNDAFKNFNH